MTKKRGTKDFLVFYVPLPLRSIMFVSWVPHLNFCEFFFKSSRQSFGGKRERQIHYHRRHHRTQKIKYFFSSRQTHTQDRRSSLAKLTAISDHPGLRKITADSQTTHSLVYLPFATPCLHAHQEKHSEKKKGFYTMMTLSLQTVVGRSVNCDSSKPRSYTTKPDGTQVLFACSKHQERCLETKCFFYFLLSPGFQKPVFACKFTIGINALMAVN